MEYFVLTDERGPSHMHPSPHKTHISSRYTKTLTKISITTEDRIHYHKPELKIQPTEISNLKAKPSIKNCIVLRQCDA